MLVAIYTDYYGGRYAKIVADPGGGSARVVEHLRSLASDKADTLVEFTISPADKPWGANLIDSKEWLKS